MWAPAFNKSEDTQGCLAKQMTIEFERQELRALVLTPIRQLPDYSADYTVVHRVGTMIASYPSEISLKTYGWDLERTLSATASRLWPRGASWRVRDRPGMVDHRREPWAHSCIIRRARKTDSPI